MLFRNNLKAGKNDKKMKDAKEITAGNQVLRHKKSPFPGSYLNQFTQPDTIIPNPGNSAGWDRYAYVNYNPINFNDPTGIGLVEITMILPGQKILEN